MASNMNARSAPGWLDYVSLDDDVKPWLRNNAPPASADDYLLDRNLQQITSMACDWAQNTLGQPIPPTPFDYRFDGWSGWNGAYLMLPYYPVLEVTSVIEYWGISGPHVLLESTPTDQVDGWQCEYPVGRLTRVFPGLVQKPWFPGSRNIQVQWTAGFNPIPARYIVGTLELIKHWWVNTQQTVTTSAPQLGTGNNQYDPGNTSGPFEGVPAHVAAIFSADIQVGIG